MELMHMPVLLDESIDYLNIQRGGIYVDGTLGGAGHSIEICKRLGPEGMLIGIDRDEQAINIASERLKGLEGKISIHHGNYIDIPQILKSMNIDKVDGILLDLGVSSFQIDNRQRGFSYHEKAPLDMRMDTSQQLTARDVVNTYSQRDLTRIIREYGEERWASRISEFIIKNRQIRPIKDTLQLVEIIKQAIPASARREGPHPARRTFQAIRIEVNKELELLGQAVNNAIKVLKPKGRLCIITFHSLEDRIVKNTFKDNQHPCECPPQWPVCMCSKKPLVNIITKKPVLPHSEEIEHNPRARSAKLRVCERI
ncbi:MAG: 16S rRNA (cytosine(1402)-N(4))-methyltransferase RsmH [Mahellales bacterium]|jgi:16S rRNA (cytosine1402-N4)-methyltransferase